MLRIPLDRPGNIGRGFSLVGRWREPLPNLEKGVVQAGAGGAWAEQVPRRGAGLGVGGWWKVETSRSRVWRTLCVGSFNSILRTSGGH